MDNFPPLGLCVSAKYSRVRDGDTAEFILRTGQVIAIRPFDFSAPETDEVGGSAATNRLHEILSKAKEIRLFIPPPSTGKDDTLDIVDIFKMATFDRVLAHIYIDGKLLENL